MIKLKKLLRESPLTKLGDKFLTKTVDRNKLHHHRFRVYVKHRYKDIFLGGINVKEDAIAYARAYFETHGYNEQPGWTVVVVRVDDGKIIKEFTK